MSQLKDNKIIQIDEDLLDATKRYLKIQNNLKSSEMAIGLNIFSSSFNFILSFLNLLIGNVIAGIVCLLCSMMCGYAIYRTTKIVNEKYHFVTEGKVSKKAFKKFLKSDEYELYKEFANKKFTETIEIEVIEETKEEEQKQLKYEYKPFYGNVNVKQENKKENKVR